MILGKIKTVLWTIKKKSCADKTTREGDVRSLKVAFFRAFKAFKAIKQIVKSEARL